MATGTILLSPQSATLPDASASNAAPQLGRRKSTAANPAPHLITALFDPATDEHLWWQFRLPTNYASGGTIDIQWTANATTGSVVWGAKVGAITPADTDTPYEHAMAAATTTTTATNTTEANRLNTTSIAPSADSAAAGDMIYIVIYRDADNGSDTVSVDAEFIQATFDYTTT